jgi:ATP synthase protein I
MNTGQDKLLEKLKKDVSRQERAARERRTLLAQTVYLGTMGIMMALPIVIGAYLGRWLDEKLPGFSTSWTISLIVIGVFVGSVSVYLFLRENR